MARCKDCVHYEDPCDGFTPSDLDSDVFDYFRKGIPEEISDIDERCGSFKNKADVVEVETIKSWLYSIAINNVGININSDFSDACEEIISRLDGLRRFAKERSNEQ